MEGQTAKLIKLTIIFVILSLMFYKQTCTNIIILK